MTDNPRKAILKIYLLIISTVLSGCVAYPAYYPPYTVAPNPSQAQSIANEECAKTGKVAVKVEPTNCDGQNCSTKFICK